MASAAAPEASNSSPVPPSAIAALFGRIKGIAADVVKQAKPWGEVVDRSSWSKPENLTEAATRVRKNAAYFRINYLIVMLTTCTVTFLMNPSSLLVLGLLLGFWIYFLFVKTTPVEIAGRTLSEREKLLGMAAISFITIFFLTSVGTVFFFALSISVAVVCLHGAFREPDNLFLDDGEHLRLGSRMRRNVLLRAYGRSAEFDTMLDQLAIRLSMVAVIVAICFYCYFSLLEGFRPSHTVHQTLHAPPDELDAFNMDAGTLK
eukprot:gene3380-13417_t